MTTHIQTLPAGRRHFSSRPLWAAVAVLGVVVMALGASLIHVQTRPVDGHSVFVPDEPVEAEPQAAATRLPVHTVAPDEALVPARPAPATPEPTRTPADAAQTAPSTARPTAKPSAANQGSVRAVGELPAVVPAAVPLPAPRHPIVAAPYVVTESGVVNTGRPGQSRAKVYGTD
ncbi:hypothetical protein O4H66_07250 [Comamonadaceae bacterium G21597-S1]|nr:hypothetical protein [Comamonadaceae bacterium G21597-S1]